MTLQHVTLAFPAYIPSTVGSIYANPAATKSYVRGLLIYNSNTTTETVDIHFVPDSAGSLGTADVTNRCFRLNIAADETLLIELVFPFVLTDENDAVFAKTTTSSKVNIVPLGDIE